jgi:N utilization substance protein B
VGKRRAARESALRILYEIEFNDAGAEAALARESAGAAAGGEAFDYAAWLVRGVCARRDEIDGLIESTSAHWRIPRMAPVDRNILRMAVFEMLEEAFLAPAIVINEAIEIARRYSGDAAAQFVNGVLDAVRKKLAVPANETKEPKDTEKTEKTEETQEKKEKNRHGSKASAPGRAAYGRSRPRTKE